jgi:hypothetical protein
MRRCGTKLPRDSRLAPLKPLDASYLERMPVKSHEMVK